MKRILIQAVDVNLASDVAIMDLKNLIWDYPHPLKDDMWKARRLAEYFPFVLAGLTREDKGVLLRNLDKINLPDERKEFIRMVCGGKQNTD